MRCLLSAAGAFSLSPTAIALLGVVDAVFRNTGLTQNTAKSDLQA